MAARNLSNNHLHYQLCSLLSLLGRDGGLISPSVYETAQTLRFCPDCVDQGGVMGWLLSQQQPDGGWGPAHAPLHRDAPTLAALLALDGRRETAVVRRAIDAGRAFLERQAPFDQRAAHIDSMPIAVELIVPQLLDEAEAAGLAVDRAPYAALEAVGSRRRQLIQRLDPQPNTPPILSWEAWGREPAAELVDAIGGVGHSPAATAWWLHLARGVSQLGEQRRHAQAYLERAALATGAGIRGVVPFAWPITRFEQAFVLHTLAIAGVMDQPRLQRAAYRPLQELGLILQHSGIGFSDQFMPDGDDTAGAIAALAAAGLPVDGSRLQPFARDDRFVAYPFEMHGSITLTARAVHAFALLGMDVSRWQATIAATQQRDGWWCGDKWNISRLYGTCLALVGLRGPDYRTEKVAALEALTAHQQRDGGWGEAGRSTAVETAFATLALCSLAGDGWLDRTGQRSLARSQHYLAYALRRGGDGAPTWVGKDLYSPNRIDQAVVLAALLAAPAAAADQGLRRRVRRLPAV